MAKSRDKAVIELTTIKGVGQKRAEKLYDSGFKNIKSILDSNVDNIQAKCNISKIMAQSILDNAKNNTKPKKTSKSRVSNKSVEPTKKSVNLKPLPVSKKEQAGGDNKEQIFDVKKEQVAQEKKEQVVEVKKEQAIEEKKENLLKKATEKADTSELAMLLNITIAVLIVVTMLLILRN